MTREEWLNAANAYPKLVEALLRIDRRLGVFHDAEVRVDLRVLLRELGEDA